MGQTFNRGELLVKAIKGEIKSGMRFKKNNGEIIRFDGERFRWSDQTIMQLNVMDDESFERYEEKVTVELTQADVNSLSVMMNATSHDGLEDMFNRQDTTNEINGVSNHIRLRSLLNNLAK